MLDALGNIGDFVGGFAVIITLIYLAVQIRDNTRSTRLAAMQTAMMASQNVALLPSQNSELARVIRLGFNTPTELNADELTQFRYYMFAVFRVNEDMFVQHAAGVIDSETFEARTMSLLAMLSTPGGRTVWDSAAAYRDDFKVWVNDRLEQAKQ